MPRYRIQFKPQGVIPEDREFGVHLSHAGEPAEEGCTPDCEGWAVVVDGEPSTGNAAHIVPNSAFTVTIAMLGTLCDGQCLEWEVRKLTAETSDSAIADLTVTPDGCNGVTVEAGGSEDYLDMWFGLYPTLDGAPFCEPIIFRTVTCVTIATDADTSQFGTEFDLDGLTSYGGETRGPLTVHVNFAETCPAPVLTWNIVQTAGTPGNGETLTQTGTSDFALEFNTPSDLTDAVYVCTLVIDGLATDDFSSPSYPGIIVTFTCTNVTP